MVTSTSIPSITGTTPGGAPIVGGDRHAAKGPGPEVMDAATLIGDSVVNAGGEDLGEIKAIMLDVSSGRIGYAVLSFGGFLGMGNKLFAIPWPALTLDAGEKRFELNVSKEKLKDAPGFDKDHWPSMVDSTWATALHTYYNVTPYWEDPQPPRDPRTTGGSTISNPKVY